MSENDNDQPPPPPFAPPGGGDGSTGETRQLGTQMNEGTAVGGGPGNHEAQGELTRGQIIRGRLTDWWGKVKSSRGDLPRFRSLEASQVVEWAQAGIAGKDYVFYGNLATTLICAWFLADVTALFAGRFIPEPPVARAPRSSGMSSRPKPIEAYNVIFTRNLFNSKGIIPGEDQPNNANPGGPPVKTTLPFTLVGTMILRDETRSIATINDTQANQVYPVRVDDEIPGKARITKIEPLRVIFVNLTSNRNEFVELPEELMAVNPSITLQGSGKAPGTPGAGIEQVNPNAFSIDRREVDKAFANMNNILTQARAVPNFENGVPSGFKLFQIVPGSLYDQLGLKNGDVVLGANGELINDPMKAMNMLSQLKDNNHLELQVKRDGKTQTNSYDIH